MSCYYCDRGPKQGLDVAKYNGVPMCYGRADACMDRHVWGGPKPEPPAAKAAAAKKSSEYARAEAEKYIKEDAEYET